uniref:Protein containing DUF1814 n=1 Tax=mine drainage metagenome TaxID=410659 RepID=E6Q0R8_9ZZZZ
MPISSSSSLVDVCFAVCTAMDLIGTTVVLSGGSAATFYAPDAYQSRDADFIVTLRGDRREGAGVMTALGYTEQQSGIYVHAENQYTVEFPVGPLAIGEELVTTWHTATRGNERLHVLSRTDCVRDRLAAFYFFSDRSALAAAIAVCQRGEVDDRKIQSWSVREGEEGRAPILL